MVLSDDPVTKLTVGIEHLMATMSAGLYNQIPIKEVKVTDFSGWAGDLVTVIKDVYNNNSDYGGDWYECAKDYIGTTTKAGHFSFDDLAGDVDAVNMVKKLKENRNKTIYNEFLEYYQGNEVRNRFTTFYTIRFGADSDLLYDQALDYINGNKPAVLAMRKMLVSEYEVPSWTSEQGKQVAQAFTDVLLDFIEKE
ncbi:hypothetical protein [Virgibacillus salexigens]|uniref:Uncharacterized protein n=2 Tax=Bacillaceae TaxID=186817 RepID=A0A024QGD0_9BACI|nr:hypothetical protein [Virgibacillus massiliensis]CDQ41549.1 hypothetical protein BN990_03922 [Virgibacillus massiliensis]